jgi:16S rRNA (adenine1518-N6/adenine1519-N6)-dimethyltransferase
MNRNEVKLILKKLEIQPNKKLGQNFLIEQNVVKKILSISQVSQKDIILEVGPGLGAITEKLVGLAKKIYAIEIDYRLYSFLKDKFSIYDNIEIIHGDILKIGVPYNNKVISNIPYSITGPILEKLFIRTESPEGILIIEKSIADRICTSGNYKNFSRITIGLNSFMKPITKSNISKNCFFPSPKIPLSLIKIVPKENVNPFLLKKESRNFFLRFIAGIMPYKNKNIVNAILLFLETQNNKKWTKEEISLILQENHYSNKKVFQFEIEEYIEISKLFYN